MKEVWFITGSQHLYGTDTLREVARDSEVIASSLDKSSLINHRILFKPVLTTPESITQLCTEANNSSECIGLIAWMHTFSPAKMWIRGLSLLNKPMLHFHTQMNRDIPWDSIDMDFMNLNQSAHGDREFGFIGSRLGIVRKVVVGHWQDEESVSRIATWIRVAASVADSRELKVARFGDNMRDVAVTEGNKVSAQIKMGYSVNGYGTGDLAKFIDDVPDRSVDELISQYAAEYEMTSEVASSATLRDAARIESGMKAFLQNGNFKAFTTTFEDLHGLRQLPGLAVQRLMAEGYGFGAEGDWKTAALVRTMKVMADGLKGGTSFMEDYTCHFNPSGMKVLGAHMLEVCPTISAGRPRIEIHPLSIGSKDDPARLVFKAAPGNAINVSIIDLGERFRIIVNDLQVAETPDMPKLPVASVLWKPLPDLKTGAEAWILAGGAHHTCFSTALTAEYIEDFADMMDIELLHIGDGCSIREFRKELRTNEVYFRLR